MACAWATTRDVTRLFQPFHLCVPMNLIKALAGNDPSNPAVHCKKPHRHPTFRFVLEVVRADRRQNRKRCYFAHERNRDAAAINNHYEIGGRLIFNPSDDRCC